MDHSVCVSDSALMDAVGHHSHFQPESYFERMNRFFRDGNRLFRRESLLRDESAFSEEGCSSASGDFPAAWRRPMMGQGGADFCESPEPARPGPRIASEGDNVIRSPSQDVLQAGGGSWPWGDRGGGGW